MIFIHSRDVSFFYIFPKSCFNNNQTFQKHISSALTYEFVIFFVYIILQLFCCKQKIEKF